MHTPSHAYVCVFVGVGTPTNTLVYSLVCPHIRWCIRWCGQLREDALVAPAAGRVTILQPFQPGLPTDHWDFPAMQ